MTSQVVPSPTPFADGDLDSIQGVGIARFKKNHQELIFFTFGSTGARRMCARLHPLISSASEVADFNEDYSEARRQHGLDPDMRSLWVGLGISASGLAKLGVDLGTLPPGPGSDAFVAGMASRASQIGDVAANTPTQWLTPFASKGGVDAVLIAAADDPGALGEKVESLVELITSNGGQVVFAERGATLPGALRGHEHFGFKDGGSQPAILGYDPAPLQNEPPAVPAGEFVVGYSDAAGNRPAVNEAWRNGSFLIFRRLVQDVAAFQAVAGAGVAGSEPAVAQQMLAAKMVGRWPSGAPLEKFPDADPGAGHEDNDFQYKATDDGGQTVPTWAHIRKANPRDETQPAPTTPDDDPVRRRMIRCGIPFGPPFSPDGDPAVERGLHFLAVVSDVVRQFEFIQSAWMSNVNFPKGSKSGQAGSPYSPPSPDVPGDGPDPITGEGNTGKSLQYHQALGTHPIQLAADLVRVTAGEYFFVPSLATLAGFGT